MSEPRAYTTEEMRRMFLDHLTGIVRYWEMTKIDRPEFVEAVQKAGGELRYRMEGALFSILVMLDGCSGGMPAFDIYPSPHEEDAAYHRENGENWWSAEEDIHGGEMLHDGVHAHMRGYDQVLAQMPGVAPDPVAIAKLRVALHDDATSRLPWPEAKVVFKKCEKGHGWLTAENWVEHGCPTCEEDKLRADRDRLIEAVLGLSHYEAVQVARELKEKP